MRMRGYLRPGGHMGIRNHVMVLSSAGSANAAERCIADAVPGAVFLPNSKGCGQVGQGTEIMRRCLVNLTLNPNVYGTLLVGLGCESTEPHQLVEGIRAVGDKPLEVITIKECAVTVRAIEQGAKIAHELADAARKNERVEMDLSKLVPGTNCGGSDAAGGVAANSEADAVNDRVVAVGGRVILGETTELIGTEEILAARAATPAVADDTLRIVHGLEDEFRETGVDVRGANPSLGNMKGGLPTLEEKGLGGISKGGTTQIRQVIPYGQIPSEGSLVIMNTPGYDIESVTGMACGGAQTLIFTTG